MNLTCKLCSVVLKTRHFLSQNAQSLNTKGKRFFLDKLRNNLVQSGKVNGYIQTPELLIQLMLNASIVLDHEGWGEGAWGLRGGGYSDCFFFFFFFFLEGGREKVGV